MLSCILPECVVSEAFIAAVITRSYHSSVGFELLECLECLVSLDKNQFGHDIKMSRQEAMILEDNAVLG